MMRIGDNRFISCYFLNMKDFLSNFYQHIAWALGAFCAFAIAFEWLIPSSVTPYLHLVPIAIVACILLCCDAVFVHVRESLIEQLFAFAFPLLLVLFTVLTYRGPGITDLVAMVLIALMMFGSAGFVFLSKRED